MISLVLSQADQVGGDKVEDSRWREEKPLGRLQAEHGFLTEPGMVHVLKICTVKS